ncbi:MAG: LPS export ABC transporter permease LptF [Gammaproteobacteria bacterium]|nr:LPS export ABC transporter permease LptF [Gammaproteobacteria bacterium]
MVVAFRYITKELLLVFVVVFAVLLAIALGGRFIGYLQDAAMGRFSADVLLPMIGLRLPEFVQIAGPFALFLALLMTYGRLHAEQEFTVLLSGGANPLRMLGWLAAVLVPMGLAVAYLTIEVTPNTKREFLELSLQQRVESEFDALTPGVFHNFYHGTRVTYAESVDADRHDLSGVFMGDRSGAVSIAVWAESGRQYRDPDTGSRFLKLENGTRYEGSPGDNDYRVVRFGTLYQRIERSRLVRSSLDIGSQPTAKLDLSDPTSAAEYHWRVGFPWLVVIGGMCAFGLARVRPRAGRFSRVLPGVVLFIAYYLMLALTKNAIVDEIIPHQVGLWPVHAVMLGVAFYLIRQSYRPV